jgi:hypothetical protein
VFSSTGKLVYKEILKTSKYYSVAQGDRFLLGGRNEVLRYSFKR